MMDYFTDFNGSRRRYTPPPSAPLPEVPMQRTKPVMPPAAPIVTPAPSTTPAPVTPAPAPAAPLALGFAGLPSQYVSGLSGFVGDPATYYGANGGEKQAQQDYYSMLNMWQQRTGLPLTPDTLTRVWHALNQYRNPSVLRGENRAFTMGDALNYLNRMLARAPEQPMVSYLQTGEI